MGQNLHANMEGFCRASQIYYINYIGMVTVLLEYIDNMLVGALNYGIWPT